ncbi:MAG: 4Fe-4S ferredoxin [Verrucomicrobia bacterium]|nr:4Fe-4S ferredoxin [Verrucomicrobiota bacterium]
MSSRREFLKQVGVATGAVLLGSGRDARAERLQVSPYQWGVLVDTTRCIGCRRCEKACNDINADLPRKDAAAFKDNAVFGERRRMDAAAYTVVNRYQNRVDPAKPVFAKFQCMHCLYPACVSACIVGALTRDETGAIVYDAGKCIGCRYCMSACPFQVPAYEYSNAFTPQVRKCTFCFKQRLSQGGMPACVQSCPMEVMTFGKRAELLKMAGRRIAGNPDRYVQHIYGENEVGGTAWLYLSGVAFEDIDLPGLGYHPAPGYTEPIQHTIFKWFLPPLSVYATLGGIWWYLARKRKREQASAKEGHQ